MGPLGYRRSTPNASSTDGGMKRAAPDGRSSRAVLRALALLIDRVVTVQTLRGPGKADEIDAELVMQPLVRDALRQLTARSRDGALLCRIIDGQLVLEGVRQIRGTSVNQVPGAGATVISNQGGIMHPHSTLILGEA